MNVFRPRRLLVASTLATVLALPSGMIASAHATLVRTNVKPGAVFTASHSYPRTLTAFFAENVDPKGSFVHVFEAAGDHAMVDADHNGFPFKNQKEITASLPRNLKGTYEVIWFTVSADDGHKAGGSFTFTVK